MKKSVRTISTTLIFVATLSSCVWNEKTTLIQDDGTKIESANRTESAPFWYRFDDARLDCTSDKCYPLAPTFILTPDLKGRLQLVSGKDPHELSDGSKVQLFRVKGETIDSIISNLSKIVAIHCNDDGCIGIDITHGDPIHADKTRIAIVLTYGAIRIVKPHWLPDKLTGRKPSVSTPSSGPVTGGPTPPAPPTPPTPPVGVKNEYHPSVKIEVAQRDD